MKLQITTLAVLLCLLVGVKAIDPKISRQACHGYFGTLDDQNATPGELLTATYSFLTDDCRGFLWREDLPTGEQMPDYKATILHALGKLQTKLVDTVLMRKEYEVAIAATYQLLEAQSLKEFQQAMKVCEDNKEKFSKKLAILLEEIEDPLKKIVTSAGSKDKFVIPVGLFDKATLKENDLTKSHKSAALALVEKLAEMESKSTTNPTTEPTSEQTEKEPANQEFISGLKSAIEQAEKDKKDNNTIDSLLERGIEEGEVGTRANDSIKFKDPRTPGREKYIPCSKIIASDVTNEYVKVSDITVECFSSISLNVISEVGGGWENKLAKGIFENLNSSQLSSLLSGGGLNKVEPDKLFLIGNKEEKASVCQEFKSLKEVEGIEKLKLSPNCVAQSPIAAELIGKMGKSAPDLILANLDGEYIAKNINILLDAELKGSQWKSAASQSDSLESFCNGINSATISSHPTTLGANLPEKCAEVNPDLVTGSDSKFNAKILSSLENGVISSVVGISDEAFSEIVKKASVQQLKKMIEGVDGFASTFAENFEVVAPLKLSVIESLEGGISKATPEQLKQLGSNTSVCPFVTVAIVQSVGITEFFSNVDNKCVVLLKDEVLDLINLVNDDDVIKNFPWNSLTDSQILEYGSGENLETVIKSLPKDRLAKSPILAKAISEKGEGQGEEGVEGGEGVDEMASSTITQVNSITGEEAANQKPWVAPTPPPVPNATSSNSGRWW